MTTRTWRGEMDKQAEMERRHYAREAQAFDEQAETLIRTAETHEEEAERLRREASILRNLAAESRERARWVKDVEE